MTKIMLENPEALLKIVTMDMPYGKYKGRKLMDLPESYVSWYCKEGTLKGELAGLLHLLHEIQINGLTDLLKPLKSKFKLNP